MGTHDHVLTRADLDRPGPYNTYRQAGLPASAIALPGQASMTAAAHPQPGWTGVVLVVPLFLSMRFLQFFLSHYLNEIVDSERRATALSFRGLTINLAYGTLTLLFGWQTIWVGGQLHLSAEDPRVFATALQWWPWWFAVTLLAAGVWMWGRTFSTAKDERIVETLRH